MSTTAIRWRALAVAAVLVAAVAGLALRPVRLGLDLQGGTQVVLEAQAGAAGTVTMTPRPDRGGVTSTCGRARRVRADPAALRRTPDHRGIAGCHGPGRRLAVIGRTAQLAFHPVVSVSDERFVSEADEADPAAPPGGEVVLTDEDGVPLRLATLTGEAVDSARAALDQGLGAAWLVQVDFRGEGAGQWADLTGDAACASPGDPARRVAIVLDNEVISSPQVSPEGRP